MVEFNPGGAADLNAAVKARYEANADTNAFTDEEKAKLAALEPGLDGAPGVDGEDGVGVPAGGATGQMLAKASATDFDTAWVDPPEGGGGGTVTSTGPFDAWLPPNVAGRYIVPGALTASGNRPVGAMVANALMGAPFEVGRALSITHIGLAVTTAGGAGTVAKAVILEQVDPDSNSLTLLAESGDFAVDAVAIVDVAFAYTFQPGRRYFVAVISTGTPSIRLLDKLAAAAILRDGQGYPYPRLYLTGLTYASLPATVTGAAAYADPPYILMTRA